MIAALRAAGRLQQRRAAYLRLCLNSTESAVSSLGLWRVLVEHHQSLQYTNTRNYASKAKNKHKQKSNDALDEELPRGHKHKGVETTEGLVPGSQQILTGDTLVEYKKTESKMDAAVEWFRKEVTSMQALASGRVTPDVLKPVRVVLPEAKDEPPSKLSDIATIGVRDGTILIVTVFEESYLKPVEKAIYDAKIPHVVPQRLDQRTIKIPMPKPTVEARTEVVKTASKLAEDRRVHLRKLEQASVKKGGYAKYSRAMEQFHELLQKHIKVVDTFLAEVKKSMGSK